jgi:hypothetical protein
MLAAELIAAENRINVDSSSPHRARPGRPACCPTASPSSARNPSHGRSRGRKLVDDFPAAGVPSFRTGCPLVPDVESAKARLTPREGEPAVVRIPRGGVSPV